MCGLWHSGNCAKQRGGLSIIGFGFLAREKRSGALELLLVTPVSANKLIFGQRVGLLETICSCWVGSGVVLYSVTIAYALRCRGSRGLGRDSAGGMYSGLRISDVAGICYLFCTRVKNLIAAAALTWVVLCLPAVTAPELYLHNGPLDLGSVLLVIVFSYSAFALLACFMLRHSLSRRIYSF